MRVMGIDPGVTGALAVVQRAADGVLTIECVHDLPTVTELTSSGKARRRVDPVALAGIIHAVGPCDRVIVERLLAPPGIASITAYSLGATAATIATVLAFAGITHKIIAASVWKRAMECPAHKEQARKHAIALFGHDRFAPRQKDHNRAEAALIAAYGARAG
jgi:crossover junction endodeoxyribonuclease RuvC